MENGILKTSVREIELLKEEIKQLKLRSRRSMEQNE